MKSDLQFYLIHVSHEDVMVKSVVFNVIMSNPEDGRFIKVSDTVNENSYSSLDELINAFGLNTNIHGNIKLDNNNSVKNPDLIRLIEDKYTQIFNECDSFESVAMIFNQNKYSFSIEFYKIKTHILSKFGQFKESEYKIDTSIAATNIKPINRTYYSADDSYYLYSIRELLNFIQSFLNRLVNELSYNYSIIRMSRDMYTDNISLSRHPDFMGMG